ncbi:MAG: hypothetical protein QM775_14720 [Pirellulales bacterium]
MDKLLVTRPETLIGAAAVQTLGAKFDLVGDDIRETAVEAVCEAVAQARPNLVIHGGAFSVAGWDVGGLGCPVVGRSTDDRAELENVGRLSDVCRAVGAKLVVVVTDGMFAGPHMFHNENARPNAAGAFVALGRGRRTEAARRRCACRAESRLRLVSGRLRRELRRTNVP